MIYLLPLLYACGVVVLFGSIFKKMGYSWLAGFFSVIPLLNLIWLVYVATAEWPIERKLLNANDDEAAAPADHITLMLRRAEAFEQRGEYAESIELFELIASELNGAPGSRFAQHCANRLRRRIAS